MTKSLACLLLIPSLCASGCGGTSGSGPSSGPKATTFDGSTRIAANGVCSGLSHEVTAGSGTLTVTLDRAEAPRLMVQVCATDAVNHATDCTIAPFALLAIGQTASGEVKRGRVQVATVYPEGCGGPTSPATNTINYSITVKYPG